MPHRRSESGIAVILGVGIVTLLFILAAVSFDLALLYSGRAQARHTANLSALSALKAHFEVTKEDGETQEEFFTRQKAAALAAANRVLSSNAMIGTNAAYNALIEYDSESKSKDNSPQLAVGSWIQNVDAEDCPESKYEGIPPCFEVYDPIDNPTVTAYLVLGQLAADVKGMFTGFVKSSLKIDVAAVATFQPVNFTGILDTSRSVAYITHRQVDEASTPCYKAEFAYSGGALSPGFIADIVAQGDRDVDGSGLNDGLPANPCRHYANDYEQFATRTDGSYGAGDLNVRPDPSTSANRYSTSGLPANFMIDLQRDFGMPGPEPFASILTAYDAALDSFEDTAKFGDRASLVAVNDNLYWTSVILPQTSLHFDKIKEMLDIGTTTSKGLINNFYPMESTFTHLKMGIEEALEHRKLTGNSNILGMLVLITDGVSNCLSMASGGCEQFYDYELHHNRTFCCNVGHGNCFSDGMPEEEFYRCENSYSVHKETMEQLLDFVHEEIIEPGIATLSVIHVGPGANIRNKSGGGENGCISSDEAYEEGIFPVHWELTLHEAISNFQDFVDNGGPFYEPSRELFRLAARSGGIYVPILAHDPACNETCDDDPNRPAITCSQTPIVDQVKKGLKEIVENRSPMIGHSK